MDNSKVIFGNRVSPRDAKKAEEKAKGFVKKYGDDRNAGYHLKAVPNGTVGRYLGIQDLVLSDEPLSIDTENSIIIGNIRMGFGHYRISMAIASAAHSMGLTPYWFDLNSFKGTTATSIISSQNDLYSLGSRISQKSVLFNKLVWEPVNSEGFRKLSYNSADQKMTELMTGLYGDFPKDIPFAATHVWPAQGAVHAGLTNVVNVVPDNWPMALHLAEGSVHTVQTQSAYMGYKVLRGMDKKRSLRPMPDEAIKYTGHYIDHELVSNIEADNARRLARLESGAPRRYLLTIGGAGAQQEMFAMIIRQLLPSIRKRRAALIVNLGDHRDAWNGIRKLLPDISCMTTEHADDFSATAAFAEEALDGALDGIHVFCHSDIFAAVYSTNLLMRACDVLITKPSELAFYPVPKLMIKRVGGHEAWGAVRAAELGDGSFECDTMRDISSMLKSLQRDPTMLRFMCGNIEKAKSQGTYDGAYKVVELALRR
ncbi:hypothetical protein SAMN02910447_01341 [Ruminococcus sp. YE71]|uniref:DUF6937 domain-containing protein n=1 Tax=unclassified Ruminococcus TaxID=2608920 RepID=UPI000883BABA|nr:MULTISPECIES: hypothetical protein [unclassified Ruminococcus]SDA17591.1 hypothetical protein SAMN02910446_01340 [Ruminococcus sp. YE78]SFW27079.1 hypothetical protein SAMN02910447_01341 [Ruminococcus sp. YE71]